MRAFQLRAWSQADLCDGAAVLTIYIVAVVAALTFRDYGLGWDDFTHAQYGELLLAFYRSGFTDQRALSFVNLYMYGGGFDMAAALLAKVVPLPLFEARRLAGAAVGVLALLLTWRLARRVGGPLTGLLALLLLAACPLFYGHMFMNPKDVPFAAAMTLLLLAIVRALQEFPRPGAATVILFGIGLGLSIGSRTLAVLAAAYALAALALLTIVENRALGARHAFRRLLVFTAYLLPGLLLGYLLMGLVWPWAVIDPLNPLRAVAYFSHFFEKPWKELFAGELILVPDMPRRYVPTLLALKLPELFVVLGIAGTTGALAAAGSERPVRRRAVLLLLAGAAALPIAVAVATRPAMYNGVRHFLFVLPPLAVLGGLAAAWIVGRVSQRSILAAAAAILLAAGLLRPIFEMVRLHPYEYTAFNSWVGGVAGARDRYMLDYWALSFKQASQQLAAHIEHEKLAKPSDRRWKLAVCGPHRSPQVELGPDFETTWDPQGADFALMLGEFYCARFEAPVIAEISRAGVVYARAYDLRGRDYPSLVKPGL